MVRFLIAFMSLIIAQTAWAEDAVHPSRTIFQSDVDLVGTDLAQIFDTTLSACQAACENTTSCQGFTFNSKSNACFPKSNLTSKIPFAGAISGFVYATNPTVLANLRTRVGELSFLEDRHIRGATQMVEKETWRGRKLSNDAWRLAQVAKRDDGASDWLTFARHIRLNGNSNQARLATPASISAYLRAITDADRRAALVEIAAALEKNGPAKLMIPALRAAQDIAFQPETVRALEDAIGKYGFRVIDTQIDNEVENPRACAIFSDNLIDAGVDYTPFVNLIDPTMLVTASGQQLCIEGGEHGETIRVVLRQGLPAQGGEVLHKAVELNFYIRDRSPAVRFTSRAYILPRVGDIALPITTVNTNAADLVMYRVEDRNVLRSMQQGVFGNALSRFEEGALSPDIGSKIWEGSLRVTPELNQNVKTRVPLAGALRDQTPGLYVVTAQLPDLVEATTPATQWFILSDIGISTYLGQDGLTVSVRNLEDAAVLNGVSISLLSRANAVLGTMQSGSDGVARFAPGLTKGIGGNAPAMVIARRGDDMAFLSLSDPAFDLSDRGVQGREPSPPMDVFLTPDRGAYRAGDTVFATALVRDRQVRALSDAPLTAILYRPDGVEYSRHLSNATTAGGHVFEMPVGAAAPRGSWRIAVYVDTQAAALAQARILVEDFIPERVDFDLSLDDEILPGQPTNLNIDARYLFGPPATGLAVEGEAILRAASGIDGYSGYQFGRHDQDFNPEVVFFDPTKTDEQGAASVEFTPPETTVNRPLEVRVIARLREGAGRPVERRITQDVQATSTMIGIKPLFDGTLDENARAEFQVVALAPDQTLQALPIKWTVNKVSTRYQWYQLNGRWNWDRVTTRERIASGDGVLGSDPFKITTDVAWGAHELIVESTSGDYIASSTSFAAGWYASASTRDTPDVVQASLDAESYKVGDIAKFRIVPRADGVAVVTVLSDRVISMKSVAVRAGENTIDLPVTEEWGAGVYVSASVIRPMDIQQKRNPSRALGLAYGSVDPGTRALSVALTHDATVTPRGRVEIGIDVRGIQAGETAYVTLAAADLGVLNITGFKSPNPAEHYFGQRKLGVELRDVYGRLIDGLTGALGEVRSGGGFDALADDQSSSPPPNEDLVSFFSGPVEIGADGTATVELDLPDFNGALRLMAVAWSDTGVGQANSEMIVRDPIVVSASLPRFMAPGDTSRMLLELVHTDGPGGDLELDVTSDGLILGVIGKTTVQLVEGGKTQLEVPITAGNLGTHTLNVNLTTPLGQVLNKTLTLGVIANDAQIAQTRRFTLAPGSTFSLDDAVFADFQAGTGRATMSVGPLARFDVPGLMNVLDRYPYGCTEQTTSRAMPLLYLQNVADAMGLDTDQGWNARISDAIRRVTANQSSNGGFGLWRPGSGDLWLDAYVTDFLVRARAAGHHVPEIAMENAIANLRNAVNFHPDFDEGGQALAYALYVLAKVGEATAGDLRFFADQKASAFSTPLAKAQLAGALAQYGDRQRANGLFVSATALALRYQSRTEANIWRSDYGSDRRDIAVFWRSPWKQGSRGQKLTG